MEIVRSCKADKEHANTDDAGDKDALYSLDLTQKAATLNERRLKNQSLKI